MRFALGAEISEVNAWCVFGEGEMLAVVVTRVPPQIERKASVHEVSATDDESGDAEAMDLLCRRRFSMRSSLETSTREPPSPGK